MKIALWIVGSIVALVVLVAVIGCFVSRTHTARRTAHFSRPAAEIFAIITNYAEMATWQPGVARVEMLEPRDGKVRYRTHGKFGPMTMLVEESRPPTFMRGRIEDEDLGFGGTWTYEVAPADGGGATLTITEDGFIDNVIFRAMARFVFGYEKTMDNYLRALGRKLGQDVEPK